MKVMNAGASCGKELILMYKPTKEEQETIILTSEADYTAEVYTYNKPMKRRLKQLSEKFPDMFYQIKDDGWGGLTYIVPKKYVKINSPRILSKEQAEKATARLHGK